MDDYNNTLCVCGSPRHRHTHDTVGRGPCLDGNGCTEFRLPRGAVEPQRIEDLTAPPVVGVTYLVPCIYGTSHKRPDPKSFLWNPIIGPAHSDAEYIGFEPQHFHYDHRFLSAVVRDSLRNENFFFESYLLFVITHWDKDEGIKHLPMVCLREIDAYPSMSFHDELSEAYADKCVTTCGKCPHRGLPLSSLPREPGTSIVTCPGHGLRWDMDTGKLVRP